MASISNIGNMSGHLSVNRGPTSFAITHFNNFPHITPKPLTPIIDLSIQLRVNYIPTRHDANLQCITNLSKYYMQYLSTNLEHTCSNCTGIPYELDQTPQMNICFLLESSCSLKCKCIKYF